MDYGDESTKQDEQLLNLQIVAARATVAAASGAKTCVDCGAFIPMARRVACPWAVRCVDCQREFEDLSRKGHAYAHIRL